MNCCERFIIFIAVILCSLFLLSLTIEEREIVIHANFTQDDPNISQETRLRIEISNLKSEIEKLTSQRNYCTSYADATYERMIYWAKQSNAPDTDVPRKLFGWEVGSD